MKKPNNQPTLTPLETEKLHNGKRPGYKFKASDHRKGGSIRIKTWE